MVINMMRNLLITFVLTCNLFIASCSVTTQQQSLYQELGGKEKIAEIVSNFIEEIQFNADIYEYFKDTDVERFNEKLNEHICFLINGPCEYTGDSMADVHTGMNISERDFNLGVDLFINAMDKANVAHTTQNKVLNILAKTRKEMIYL